MKHLPYRSLSLADLIHEISGPLTALRLSVDRLTHSVEESSGTLPEELAASMRGQVAAAEAAISQTLGVLDAARGEEAVDENTSIVDVRSVVRDAAQILSSRITDEVTFETRLDPTPDVMGTRIELTQTVLNLVCNALEAVDEAGSRASKLRVVTGTDDRGRAIVEISDNGAGIPSRWHERIFERAMSTKPGASRRGLGLSICREVVERHGGEISVASTIGVGSCFRVVLPPADASAATTGAERTR